MRQIELMWGMMRFRPWLYLTDAVLWTLIHLAPLAPGLIAREFFDTLTGDSALELDLWALIALLVATALARIALIYAGVWKDVELRFNMSALLWRNLLARILETYSRNREGALTRDRGPTRDEVLARLDRTAA